MTDCSVCGKPSVHDADVNDRMSDPSRFVTSRLDLRGVSLVVDMQGAGLPVVFVHGFPLDRSMWATLLRELPTCRRIVPDLRGLGSSTWSAADRCQMSDYADDLVALLDRFDLSEAVFCGLSMGGYVVFDVAKRHPDRVRAMVLANTRAAADSPPAKRARVDAARLVAEHGPSALVETMLPRLLAPETPSSKPDVVDHVRRMIAGNRRDGVIAALWAMQHRADATALLPTLTVPVLVVAGAEDRIVPVAEARSMAEAIPGAVLTVVPDAGHLAPLEQPAVVGRAIRDFLVTVA